MENINKSQLSAALKNALKDEHLWSRDAAGYLNINPIYVSFMLNPNSFDKCGSTAWKRLNEWFLTKEPLSSFKFPEGEPVWQPKKEEPNVKGPGVEAVPGGKKIKKEKPDKKTVDPGSVTKVVKEVVEEKVVKETGEKTFVPEQDPVEIHKKLVKVAADDIWGKIYAKLCEYEKTHVPGEILETTVPSPVTQKVALDIEINLTVGGQKIKLM